MSRAEQRRWAIAESVDMAERETLLDDDAAALASLCVPVGRTQDTCRGMEWQYVTQADLDSAAWQYGLRAEIARRALADAPRGGRARARRALRIAEHAATVAARQHLEATYPTDDESGDVDRLGEYWALSLAEHAVRPLPSQVINASVDPMGVQPWSMALENIGTRLLHAHGVRSAQRPDVYSRRHGQHVARPDRVAFKGTVRYSLPQPCRYGKVGNEPAQTTRDAVRLVDVSDVPHWATVPVTELLVMPRQRREGGAWVPNTGTVRVAWRGHRTITVQLASRRSETERARATKRAAQRATDKVAARGPAVTPWALSPRSLPAAVKRDPHTLQHAERLESIVRTLSLGESVDVSDGAVITLTDRSAATVVYRDVAYPAREWSRRAALAGLDI